VALNDHFCEEYYQMWHHFHAIWSDIYLTLKIISVVYN
jgi:hypothetical protein